MQLASFRRKNIQLLATLMATATYAAGFNPPGGVWQDTAGRLAGDPVMRSTHHHRYLVFFYFNAAAFALSLMVVVVTLILAACTKESRLRFDVPLLLLMATATVAFVAAYGTATCRDKFRVIVFSLTVASVVPTWLCQLCFYLILSADQEHELDDTEKKILKLIAPLSMFALTISYVAGLSTPGGFWDDAEGGHRRPGDEIMHGYLLRLFFWFNSGQFIASLSGFVLVMLSGLYVRLAAACMTTGLLGLIVSYTVGSSRGHPATVGVICGLCVAVWAYVILHVAVRRRFSLVFENFNRLLWKAPSFVSSRAQEDVITERQRRRAASLVQLLAGLAVSITYTAGMYPPGGVWQDGDKAGDPILLTTNPGRYRAFFYCNSVAFVASLLAILLGQMRYLAEQHALHAAMILDLLALIVAYAIGSCRDQISSMYVLGIAAAAVVYVVVHVQYFTLGSGPGAGTEEDAAMVDKTGGRFLLFAILVASITYQAGLTPPGGFMLQDDFENSGRRVGDPVLLHNYPRRYKAFFYCNSLSFMVSTVLLLLLVNPNMYRPAIRSHALSLCSAVSFVCLVGAFAAGSTQHLKTTIHIFVVASVAVFLCLPLLLTVLCFSYRPRDDDTAKPPRNGDGDDDRSSLNKVYLMTLGILVASVTYQAGLDPPGGSWQNTSDGHDAGHPVMHDKRRNRYLAFLWGNSTSFLASIYLIEILLFTMFFPNSDRLKKSIAPMVGALYLGFLVAYAAGSSRQWKTSAHVCTLVTGVLAFVAAHVMLTLCIKKKLHRPSERSLQQQAPAQALASSVVNQINTGEGP